VRLDVTGVTPYLGISPDAVESVEPTGEIPYLLTIENLASFQRHVREIQDRAVVIYTAGFPGPDLIRVVQHLDGVLAAQCRFLHRGDRDVGGLRIFAQLAAAVTAHDMQPHLMDVPGSNSDGFSEADRRTLEDYAVRSERFCSLARRWLDAGLGPLEQESLDPTAP
jgi:hypothetical protein